MIKYDTAFIPKFAIEAFLRLSSPQKNMQANLRDYPDMHSEISSRFPRSALRANFAIAKFGFMQEALKEAELALSQDEVPVGCVIVHKGRIISRGYNQIERLKDPTAHAEMLALTSAANYLGTKWLNEASIYVTIEPCSMCAGALVLARVKNLFFGAKDPKTGACGSVVNIANHKKLNHRIEVKGGILEKECGDLLKEFFKAKRRS